MGALAFHSPQLLFDLVQDVGIAEESKSDRPMHTLLELLTPDASAAN
jgi:hypothetical protein